MNAPAHSEVQSLKSIQHLLTLVIPLEVKSVLAPCAISLDTRCEAEAAILDQPGQGSREFSKLSVRFRGNNGLQRFASSIQYVAATTERLGKTYRRHRKFLFNREGREGFETRYTAPLRYRSLSRPSPSDLKGKSILPLLETTSQTERSRSKNVR